jgi:hypothetical protein
LPNFTNERHRVCMNRSSGHCAESRGILTAPYLGLRSYSRPPKIRNPDNQS